MKPEQPIPANIDAYIAGFPEAVRVRLQAVRCAVAAAAPGAQEKISYRIPAFTLHGSLIYFAAFKNHIGLYPGAATIKAFEQQLAGFRTAKGTVQFPFDAPLPLALISRIVRFRVGESLRRTKRNAK